MEASNKSSNSAANNIAVCHLYRGSLNAVRSRADCAASVMCGRASRRICPCPRRRRNRGSGDGCALRSLAAALPCAQAISFLNGKITELQGVNPSLVFNLCTLFELESSHAVQKKKVRRS